MDLNGICRLCRRIGLLLCRILHIVLVVEQGVLSER